MNYSDAHQNHQQDQEHRVPLSYQQQLTLAITPKFTAAVSIACSLFIICEVVRDHREKRNRMLLNPPPPHHQRHGGNTSSNSNTTSTRQQRQQRQQQQPQQTPPSGTVHNHNNSNRIQSSSNHGTTRMVHNNNNNKSSSSGAAIHNDPHNVVVGQSSGKTNTGGQHSHHSHHSHSPHPQSQHNNHNHHHHYSKNRNSRSDVVHRALFGMSCIDISSGVAWFLSTWLTPQQNGMAWAAGNTATCNLQGFLLQFAIGAPLYNCSLSLYYLLVIKYNWTQEQLLLLEKWVHAFILAFALGTSILLLPLGQYNHIGTVCWIIGSPPDCQHSSYNGNVTVPCHRGNWAWLYGICLFYGPLWICVAFTIVAMSMIICHVKSTRKRSRKYGEYEYNNNNNSSNLPLSSQQLARNSNNKNNNNSSNSVVFHPGRPDWSSGSIHMNHAKANSEDAAAAIAAAAAAVDASSTTGTRSPGQAVRFNLRRQGSLILSARSNNLSAGNIRHGSILIGTRRPTVHAGSSSSASHHRDRDEQRVLMQALLYSASFFVTWMPSTTWSIASWFKIHSFWFDFSACLCEPLQGLWNFLIFIRHRPQSQARVRTFFQTLFFCPYGRPCQSKSSSWSRSWCCCCGGDKDGDDDDENDEDDDDDELWDSFCCWCFGIGCFRNDSLTSESRLSHGSGTTPRRNGPQSPSLEHVPKNSLRFSSLASSRASLISGSSRGGGDEQEEEEAESMTIVFDNNNKNNKQQRDNSSNSSLGFTKTLETLESKGDVAVVVAAATAAVVVEEGLTGQGHDGDGAILTRIAEMASAESMHSRTSQASNAPDTGCSRPPSPVPSEKDNGGGNDDDGTQKEIIGMEPAAIVPSVRENAEDNG